MINKKRLIRLTRELIGIGSENPPGDESGIGEYVKSYLKGMGVQVKVYEFKKKRVNLVAYLPGKGKKRSLLLTPHLDTVPAGESWSFDPFAARIKRGRLYGLGATDCKGNLACGLEAINSIVEERVSLGYDLIFAATADEESGSGLGLIPLLKRGILKAEAAVVLDSDEFDIIITQKGLMHIKVKIQGKKAHGAYPWRGINAIDIAVDILTGLKTHKFIYPRNKYLKPPTLNIGTIGGGDKVNVVAPRCEFEADIRFLPGMRSGEILKDIKGIIHKRARRHFGSSGMPKNTVRIEVEGKQEPYSIDKNDLLVQYLIKASKKFGVNPRIKGSEGATTITFFQEKGIPAIATGAGSSGCAHIADEYARVDNLYKGARILEEFLKCYSFDKTELTAR